MAQDALNNEHVAFVLFEFADDTWSQTSFPVSVWAHSATGETLDGVCHIGAFLLSGSKEPRPLLSFQEEDEMTPKERERLVEEINQMLVTLWRATPSSDMVSAYAGGYASPQWLDLYSGELVPRRLKPERLRASTRGDEEKVYRARLREALGPLQAELQHDHLAEIRDRVRKFGPARLRILVVGEGVFDAEPAIVLFYDAGDREMPEHTYQLELSRGLSDDLYEDLLKREPNLHEYAVAGEEFIRVLRKLLIEAPLGSVVVEATVDDSEHIELLSGSVG